MLIKYWGKIAMVIVADFGEKEGIKTYRVNGSKKELEFLLAEMVESKANFKNGLPKIEPAFQQYTVLLEIILPTD